MSIKQIIADSA